MTSLWLVVTLHGQKPIPARTMALHQFMAPATFAPFDFHPDPKADYSEVLRQATTFRIQPEVLRSIRDQQPGLLRLAIPGTAGIQLDLYRANVFSRDAKVRTSDGSVFEMDPHHLFYRGMVHGNPNSLARIMETVFRILKNGSRSYGMKSSPCMRMKRSRSRFPMFLFTPQPILLQH
jgi:hypothetical protein